MAGELICWLCLSYISLHEVSLCIHESGFFDVITIVSYRPIK